MPISHAQERRVKAKANKEAGVVLDASGKAKKPDQVNVNCRLCSLSLRVTKRNVEMVTHCEAKHPKNSFEDCFPGQTHE
eukprot:NODE_2878_length_730_cov_56.575624_g2033_i0.p1 GENE.NODE_2878_length_730_cov_56.575624_g2033_i0~~NODE_2878_length_730_cov_56.575624_g2033_i0.p1  ORF type:complete len:79 (+),score=30.44 NODE_2878_length_730_cov_56.575624_g2033_i0:87-323(+)